MKGSVADFLRLNWRTLLGWVLLVEVCVYFAVNVLAGVFARVVANHGLVYWGLFYLPKFVPLLVFAVYLLFGEGYKRLLDRLSWVGFWVVFSVLSTTVFCFLATLPSGFVLFLGSYLWSWAGLITWSAIFCVSFLLAYRKLGGALFSFVFSVLLVSAGGMLYELPVHSKFIAGYYLDYSYPLFVGTSFVSLAFIALLLFMFKWKPTKPFFCSVLVYLVNALLWVSFRQTMIDVAELRVVGWWVPRLAGGLLLLSLVSGL